MANDYQRYAIYFAPKPETALCGFARDWLGVDAERQIFDPAPTPYVNSPRRYGFHATLKAPFRLAEGVTQEILKERVEELAKSLSRVNMGQLEITRLGRFIALTANTEIHPAVAKIAWQCVERLDDLRAPLNQQDLERRPNLDGAFKENMTRWGYPYVGKQFRFHMTLSSSLTDQQISAAWEQLSEKLSGILEESVELDAISIFGDPGAPDTFRFLERFELSA